MDSGFRFPMPFSAVIAGYLIQFGIAPVANLRPEDISKPQPELLRTVLYRFFATFVETAGDNTEHHAEAIRVLRLHRRSQAFLESIHFKDL